jgi:hemolysin III
VDVQTVTVKPLLRGVSHEISFFLSLVVGTAVAVTAPAGAYPELAIYLLAMSGLFGVSALFHRRTWSPDARRIMRRLDHSMIFLAIAGTYTAIAGLTLTGPLRFWVLLLVWGGAAIGIVAKVFWIDAPKWLAAAAYVLVGWVALIALPQLWDALGAGGFLLLLAGGLLYSGGAAVYALRRPDPWPETFGYHEVFHMLTIAGALAHLACIEFYVLPSL